jgi:hypothetical protein
MAQRRLEILKNMGYSKEELYLLSDNADKLGGFKGNVKSEDIDIFEKTNPVRGNDGLDDGTNIATFKGNLETQWLEKMTIVLNKCINDQNFTAVAF